VLIEAGSEDVPPVITADHALWIGEQSPVGGDLLRVAFG
jgi:hypothetical protein